MQIGRPDRGIDPGLPAYPTVVHMLADAVARAPDRTAVICEDTRLSYAEYGRAVAGLARLLAARGAAGGPVAVMMSNSAECAVAQLAALAAHAQLVPVNPNFTPRELHAILGDAEPGVVICDAAAAPRAREVAAELGVPHVLAFEPGGLALSAWTGDESLRLPEPYPEPDDPAGLVYTGGTTGLPKGAIHRHSEFAIYFPISLSVWRLDFDRHVFCNVAPMFHVWGFWCATWEPIYLRGTLVIVPRYKPEEVLDAFERHRVTVFFGGPPAIYFGLLAHEAFAGTDLSSLEYCFSGGAPVPEDLFHRWREATGCVLLEGWGMSEGAPINSTPVEGPYKPGAVGLTMPLTEVDIVDLETGAKVLPQGERGEIRLRGPQFAKAYRNRPEENALTFRDGWLYTGDIGFFDEDNYLHLVDRKKDMILVGGYNVYPREIDEVLHAHPKVQEAAAIGARDAFRGEIVKAFVVPARGAEVSEDELIAYCRENLVRYKVPAAIELVDALPKTGANKVDRKALRAREEAKA